MDRSGYAGLVNARSLKNRGGALSGQRRLKPAASRLRPSSSQPQQVEEALGDRLRIVERLMDDRAQDQQAEAEHRQAGRIARGVDAGERGAQGQFQLSPAAMTLIVAHGEQRDISQR